MLGLCSDAEIGLFLSGLRLKGETVQEIAGAASALRRHMTPIRSRREGIIDTCGTGGDGSRTFNISTAAAIVTAAAGVPVAKHGNRRVTSTCGSADVLAVLGVNIEADVATVEACLEELGICFCFAPLLHGAMKNVAHVRRQLGTPTIFNLLGPLSNPAHAPFQLLGVGRPELRPLTMAGGGGSAFTGHRAGARGLRRRRTRRSHAQRCTTHVTEVVYRDRLRAISPGSPQDFGFDSSDLTELLVTGPEEKCRHDPQGVLSSQHGRPPRTSSSCSTRPRR